MDDLLKYTEDKNFVRWVQKPDEQLHLFWEKYKAENPGEIKQIEAARAVILSFQGKKETVDVAGTDLLFQGIMKGIEERKKMQLTRRIGISVLKYAAIVVFVVVAGFMYYLFQKPYNFAENAELVMAGTAASTENSLLVLYNGEQIEIGGQLSFIEQLNNGNILVNGKDTVRATDSDDTQLNRLVVPEGKNSAIKLADGSVVHINSGSQFVFPSVFNKSKRQVYLAGEGFFEVKHQDGVPFVACTNRLAVEVLGTKFNLSSYPTENTIETVLVEGKVKVSETTGNAPTNTQILSPMQKAEFNTNGNNLLVSDVDDVDYVSWYKGYLSFKSKDLASIVKKLERRYDVEIKLDAELQSKTISGKLKLQEEEIDTVIQVLANTASLQVEKLSNSKYILK